VIYEIFVLETCSSVSLSPVECNRDVLSAHDGYRRGRAYDVPLVAKLGGHEVEPGPGQFAKSLCLNSKHRAREALDKFVERVPR
jgi:hypothetical protein